MALITRASLGKVSVFINGVKQQHTVDIGNVVGSINNDENMVIGTLYGWKTDGQLDEYRMYNRAIDGAEVSSVYKHMPPMPAGCPAAFPVDAQGDGPSGTS